MSVIVKGGGGENVTPEVTAQTPVITQIAENLGVTITTPSGTNKQILQGNNANLLNIKNNAKKEGLYVWKKLIAEGGDFVDFVVSDSETAYPDGGTQDGYWYEKVVEGVVGIDFGEVTLASTATSVTVNHNLGVVPQTVALFSKTIPSSDLLVGTWTAIKCHDVYAFTFGSKRHEYGKIADSTYGPNYFEITDNKITFLKRGNDYPLIGEYCWVAII